MKRRPPRTVMEVCLAAGGIRKGTRVATFITSWTIASQELGRPITLDEYADWWKEARTTSYRHQAWFRELFPHLATPQPIANEAIARHREWQHKGVAGIGQLPADVVPA